METDALDYELPPDAIAQAPVEPRDAARLLVDRGPESEPAHLRIRDLPGLLGAGDLLVLNETRVLPARLEARKATGGRVEVVVLERRGDGWWEALVRPGRRVRPGTVVVSGDLGVEVGAELGEGRRLVRLLGDGDDMAVLAAHGALPLPPYIHTALTDPERYQTVFADSPTSTAAPTAGLHFTPELLEGVRAAGVEVATVELAIGLDTFRPIRTAKLDDHVMHTERYRVPARTFELCEASERVVAVGTTVVHALESAAVTGRLEGRTELFIRGEHPFRVVDALLTNFHLPRTTLLALIDAFVGPRWRDLYAAALDARYRFLSFGDAMFLPKRDRGGRR